MKITKQNIQAFLPVNAEWQGVETKINKFNIADEYCLISEDGEAFMFEELDFTNSLKPYTDLTEQDWKEVFEAGGAEIGIGEFYLDHMNSVGFFYTSCNGMPMGVSYHPKTNSFYGLFDQLSAFMKLIEKLKR